MKRIFLSGPTLSISEDDLIKRFSSFGKVSDIDWSTSGNSFVHFSLDCEDESCKKMISAYNGTRWRNSTIRIEEAKPDWKEKLIKMQKDDASSSSSIPIKKESIRRRIRESCRIGTLVDDSMVDSLPGWVRSKYGRAVMLGHIRRLDGTIITVDPSHYKENLQKLFGSVRPLPIYKLARDSTLSSACSDLSDSSDCSDLLDNVNDTINNTNTISNDIKEVNDEEEVFSLSKLIGLPIEHIPTLKVIDFIESVEIKPEQVKILPTTIDTCKFLLTKVPPNNTYYRKYGGEEAFMFWRDGRQKMRLDFKNKIKQIRKLVRRNK